MVSSVTEFNKNNYGNSDYFLTLPDEYEKNMQNMKQQNVVTDYGLGYLLGRLYTEKDSEEELSLNVAYLDEKAKELYYISLIQGEYPVREGEIALEKATLDQINPDLKVGDSFTVFMKGQNGEDYLGDYEEKTFKLCGILKNKRSNILTHTTPYIDHIPSAFVSSDKEAPKGSKPLTIAYANIPDRNIFSANTVDANLPGEMINILWDSLEFVYTNSFLLIGLGGVFLIILLFASFIGIANSMNSNIADRKRQIGMLRTVGATKKQIKKIFLTEAIIISLCCVPVAIVISFFAVKLMSVFFGENFTLKPNIIVLLLSGVFGVLCVMISAVSPLKSAANISPIQSIRNIDVTRKMKSLRIKSRSYFDVPSLLSKRNLSFYRKKQAAVTFFIILSIIAACFGFSFTEYQKTHLYDVKIPDYAINSQINHGTGGINHPKGTGLGNIFTENDKKDFLNVKYLDNVTGIKELDCVLEFESFNDYLDCFRKDHQYYDYGGLSEQAKNYIGADKELFSFRIFSFDESVIESFSNVTEGKINIDALNSGQEVILYAPDKVGIENQNININGNPLYFAVANENIDMATTTYEKICDRSIKTGDKVKTHILFSDFEAADDGVNYKSIYSYERNLTVGAVMYGSLTDNAIYDVGGTIKLITTHQGLSRIAENSDYYVMYGTLKDEYAIDGDGITEEINDEILDVLNLINLNRGIQGTYVNSHYGITSSNSMMIRTVFIVVLSVMILLMAGSMSIINNSLTARIRENKREIGTLRAVGATHKDLTMSYIRQLLAMFGWGTGIGFGVFLSTFLCLKIYWSLYKNTEFSLEFCIWPAILATVIIFAVCSLNLYFTIKKETKNSIIDNIREL